MCIRDRRNARCAFRTPFTISGRRIEIVDAVRDGVIDQRIDHLLVDLLVAAVGNGRPAHTTVPQQRHAVARSRISAVGHLIGRNLALRRAVARRRIALRTATGQRNQMCIRDRFLNAYNYIIIRLKTFGDNLMNYEVSLH